MKILILGGNGMLGHKLVQVLSREFDVMSVTRRSFETIAHFGIFDEKRTFSGIDLTDPDVLEKVVKAARPDVVINAAGAIKQAETAHSPEIMSSVNSQLPHNLAAFAKDQGFRLICISTDCVFSGEKGDYREDDVPDATDAYGLSKRLGEVTSENCLTLRTSVVGRELDTDHSLIEWFLKNRGGRVRGFSNAIYSGFPTIVFAEILVDLIKEHPGLSGLFNVSSEPITKFDLLRLVNDAYRADVEILPDESFTIDRSLNSTKFRQLTGFYPDRWPEMIGRMAADPFPYERFRSGKYYSEKDGGC